MIEAPNFGRFALAMLMCEAAAELLSGVTLEQLLDLETVDVR